MFPPSKEAERLNRLLEREAPAAARMLSPLGRRAAFPRGIPFQAVEAKQTEINATIGQFTDGRGEPLTLPAIAESAGAMDPRRAWLYAPVEGPDALRSAWVGRQERLAGRAPGGVPLPITTHGLTHALSLVANLFADPDTEIVLPLPSWENYGLVFGLHAGARAVGYPFFRDDRFNVEGLADRLSAVRAKAIVVLNFPGNPTGYAPKEAEIAEIVKVLVSHPGPLVAVTDDAYQGWVYEPGRLRRSVFWDLVEQGDPTRLLPIKVDGATKELVFFSSRVGFVTHGAGAAADEALLSKLKYVVRGTVGCPSGPAMALVERALADPRLEASFAERRAVMDGRYKTLKYHMKEADMNGLVPYPFNSSFFALLHVADGDPESLRRRLIAEYSVGSIAFPAHGSLRLAYCSIAEEDVPELVRRVAAASR